MSPASPVNNVPRSTTSPVQERPPSNNVPRPSMSPVQQCPPSNNAPSPTTRPVQQCPPSNYVLSSITSLSSLRASLFPKFNNVLLSQILWTSSLSIQQLPGPTMTLVHSSKYTLSSTNTLIIAPLSLIYHCIVTSAAISIRSISTLKVGWFTDLFSGYMTEHIRGQLFSWYMISSRIPFIIMSQ